MSETLTIPRYKLSKAEFEKTLAEWTNTRSAAAKEKLVRCYWGAAHWMARRYARLYGANIDDVFSAALLGLMLSFDRYADKNATRLNAFVFNQMKWTIIREVPRVQYRIKLPTNVPPKIRRAIEELGLQYPLKAQDFVKLATHLDFRPEYVEAIYHAMQARDVSQGTPARAVSMGVDATIEDKLESEWPTPEDFANRKSVRAAISRILLTLTPREERIIRMRFGIGCDEHTLDEVGDAFHVTPERIRQMEGKALRKMKHPSRSIRLGRRERWSWEQLEKFQFHRMKMAHMTERERERYLYSYRNADDFELMFGKMPYQ